jgi:formylmethanofuran dehydrogenase subunit E
LTEVENPMVLFKESEPKVVAYCDNCGEDLTEQDTFLSFDGEYLCDEDCLKSHFDIREIGGWEI